MKFEDRVGKYAWFTLDMLSMSEPGDPAHYENDSVADALKDAQDWLSTEQEYLDDSDMSTLVVMKLEGVYKAKVNGIEITELKKKANKKPAKKGSK